MLYTHFNLSSIKLISVDDFLSSENESKTLHIFLENKSLEKKNGIKIGLPKIKGMICDTSIVFNLNADSVYKADLPLNIMRRGVYPLQRAQIKTTFPFNCFKAFTYASLDKELIIYPAPMLATDFSLTKLSNKEKLELDGIELRPYRVGDNISRIHWKKMAANTDLLYKDIEPPPIFKLEIDDSFFVHSDPETKLKIISGLIFYAHDEKIEWSLQIKNHHLPFNKGAMHLKNSLRILAQV